MRNVGVLFASQFLVFAAPTNSPIWGRLGIVLRELAALPVGRPG